MRFVLFFSLSLEIKLHSMQLPSPRPPPLPHTPYTTPYQALDTLVKNILWFKEVWALDHCQYGGLSVICCSVEAVVAGFQGKRAYKNAFLISS